MPSAILSVVIIFVHISELISADGLIYLFTSFRRVLLLVSVGRVIPPESKITDVVDQLITLSFPTLIILLVNDVLTERLLLPSCAILGCKNIVANPITPSVNKTPFAKAFLGSNDALG